MADLIENPVINAPYVEPSKHFVFGNDGITNELADGRRESTFSSPSRRRDGRRPSSISTA
jgi:hypothetical protein